MANNIGPAGGASFSRRLGADDPRQRRNAQADLAAEQRIGSGLQRDRRGQLMLDPVTAVPDLADDASVEDVRATLNNLLRALRQKGYMRR